MHSVGGRLKKVRGSLVVLTADRNIDSTEIIRLAVNKHCACDCTFQQTDYHLLYADGQMVTHIPGTNERFTLLTYKNFVGKAFSKLTLFLCSYEDYASGIKSSPGIKSSQVVNTSSISVL